MKSPIRNTRTIELRKSHRYWLSAPVFFCWSTPNGLLQSGDGITRDIDTMGAYINTHESPPVGAHLQMDIMLPNLVDSGVGAHLTGEGVVLRVESHDARIAGAVESGFAVSILFYVESSESVLSHLKNSGRVM